MKNYNLVEKIKTSAEEITNLYLYDPLYIYTFYNGKVGTLHERWKPVTVHRQWKLVNLTFSLPKGNGSYVCFLYEEENDCYALSTLRTTLLFWYPIHEMRNSLYQSRIYALDIEWRLLVCTLQGLCVGFL